MAACNNYVIITEITERSIEIKKQLNKIHYNNQEIWLKPGVFLFFHHWLSHCSYFVLIFLLIELQYLSKFFSSVVEITPHLENKLSFDIYLLITVNFCFPNLDKKFFVLITALIILICSYFPVNLIVLLKLLL